jgi:hypothetical protein
VFTPVLAKHTKSFNLVDTLSIGVDRIQRNFEPLQRQVETWRKTQITDDTAKLIFYSAFIDGKLEAPRSYNCRISPWSPLQSYEAAEITVSFYLALWLIPLRQNESGNAGVLGNLGIVRSTPIQ